ncbi:hypothetical protein J7K43_04385 [Candidatus Calescamantes bacterium]|nr:hypothetical protein [Candidatus Calescamantes bacterium]
MIKYRGLFLEYPAIPPGYEEAEYSSWEKEDYFKALDWCKENGINTLIFMNFGFTNPEKYPYMVDKEVPANFFFKDICSYGKKNNLHIFGGIRLDLSSHFINENPDCRAEYHPSPDKYPLNHLLSLTAKVG